MKMRKGICKLFLSTISCSFLFSFAENAFADLDDAPPPEVIFCQKHFPMGYKDKLYQQCITAYRTPSYAERQYQLGLLFLMLDLIKGRQYLTEAAQLGSADAMYALAQSYEIDDERRLDESLVLYWYKCAAEHGHSLAQARLAEIYYYGQGVAINHKIAFRWYYQAAHRDIPESQFGLARCYEKGEGVAQNYPKAFEWYLKSAEHGNVQAYIRLGDMFYFSEFGKQDYPQAAMWYKKAAEFGDPYAEFQYGAMLASGTGVPQNDKKAFYWLEESAQQDFTPAQSLLGRLWYATKRKENYEKAYKWLQRASFKGDSLASLTLGKMYRQGRGVSRNFRESAYYFQKAMPGPGTTQAEALIGLSYHQGLGKPKNYRLAAMCYTKAAMQGNIMAQFNLSTLYAQGKGVEKSLVKAYAWADIAANSGLHSAIEARRLLSYQLTYNELDEAQKLAARLSRN
ncbi:MAG: hypothetical protein BGO43_04675 [Gammaproteobacteria bacterium 39-13]|nr:MAG: hypothetical protein BGO43_04675 [Gammaproteobacteria bacterium 39-13]